MPFLDDDDFSAIPVMKAGSGIEVVPLQASPPLGDPAELASLVLNKSGWREMRDDLRLRFLDIVAVHFRAGAPLGDVREGCVRTKEKGGLGMSPVEADAVMDAIRDIEQARPRQTPIIAPVPSVPPAAIPSAPPRLKAPTGKALLEKAVALLDAGKETREIPASFAEEPKQKESSPQSPVVQRSPQAAPEKKVTQPRASVAATPPQKPVLPEPALAPRDRAPVPERSALPKSREEAIVLLTNEVVSELAMRFPDRYLEDRLRGAVSARLRDIRDWPETEETLLRPPQSGGVGLLPVEVEKVRASLESRMERIHGALYAQQKKDVVAAIAKERAASEVRAEQRSAADQKELDALYKGVTGKAPAPASRQPATPQARPLISPQKTATMRPVTSPTHAQQPPSMTDVRAPALLVGPVEELRRMTLADFRKLSTDPVEATKKIVDKLKLLESESFAKRFAGIASLKESEVFTLYYTITRTALMKGLPIAQVIADRAADALPVLTPGEFNAILALNQKLRF
jgi:hypothetical protein